MQLKISFNNYKEIFQMNIKKRLNEQKLVQMNKKLVQMKYFKWTYINSSNEPHSFFKEIVQKQKYFKWTQK